MAKDNNKEAYSLKDFSFDDDAEFFGNKPSGATDKKSKAFNIDEEDDLDDDDSKTNLEEVKTKKPATVATVKKVAPKDEEDEDDLEDETDTKSTKVKGKHKDEEEDNDPEDELDEEEFTFGKSKDETKKEAKKSPKASKEEADEVDPEDEGQAEENDDQKDKKFYTTLAVELKEKGTFQNVEIDEKKEYTEEEFFELEESEIDARVNETIEALFEELDEDAKRFIAHKKKGGDTHTFLNVYTGGLGLETFDENNPSHVKKVLNYYLVNKEELDEESLQERLEYLKESGKEKAFAAKFFTKIKKEEDEIKELIITQTKEQAAKREESTKKFHESLDKTLKATDSVSGLPFTKLEQKELTAYLTKGTVKAGKNNYITGFQADIAKIFNPTNEENRKKLLLIAKLVRSDFDLSTVTTKVKTEVTKEAKSKLREARSSNRSSTSGSYSKKSLSDYFPS